MTPIGTRLPILVVGLVLGSGAWAFGEAGGGQDKILLAGEILIGPDKSEVRTPGARSQRERAGAYQRGAEAALPVEEEGGFLSPRSGAPVEEKAFENRARARAYQQGADMPVVIPAMPSGLGDLPGAMTSQERARDLRGRARTYTGSGNAQEIDLSNVGADGIPVVTCRGEADNVAARIGEDAVPGSVFYIMRQGKPVKVRCR